MTRQAFLDQLREALVGLPPRVIDDLIADYGAHFDEGDVDGRDEDEIALSLGDQRRLARELRAELHVQRWESEHSVSTGIAAIIALLGLGAVDLLFLLPVLLGVGFAVLALGVVALVLFFVGSTLALVSPISREGIALVEGILHGFGMMAGAASGAATLALLTIGIMNLLARYGRLHYRLLEPALHVTRLDTAWERR